jgi:hypothetical protein
MRALLIRDLNFIEDQPCKLQGLGGGFSVPKFTTSVSTSVDIKSDTDVDFNVTLSGKKLLATVDIVAYNSAAISAAVSGSVNGVALTSASTNINLSYGSPA